MITPEQHATLHAELKGGGGKNGSSNSGSNGSSSSGRTPAAAPRQTHASMRATVNSTSIANSITVEDSPTTSADEKDVEARNSHTGSSSTGDKSKQTSSASQQDTTVAPLRSSLSSLHLLTALSSHSNGHQSSNAHAPAVTAGKSNSFACFCELSNAALFIRVSSSLFSHLFTIKSFCRHRCSS